MFYLDYDEQSYYYYVLKLLNRDLMIFCTSTIVVNLNIKRKMLHFRKDIKYNLIHFTTKFNENE